MRLRKAVGEEMAAAPETIRILSFESFLAESENVDWVDLAVEERLCLGRSALTHFLQPLLLIFESFEQRQVVH